jgi:hypothetical protein
LLQIPLQMQQKLAGASARWSGSPATPPQPVNALQIQAEPVIGDTHSGA